MVEVEVWSLAIDEKNQYPVVILQTRDGSKRLPIWIGPPEASAIAMEIAGKKFQRPLTHDLLAIILQGMGVHVQRVEVTELVENTFYAKIYLEREGEVLCIDARPSDSIAIALKTKARIFVNPQLFSEEVGSLFSTVEQVGQNEEDEERRAEDLRRFIEDLNPKDFGKFSF
ncbi:MAG: bifunctional nuclease family protein [Candidatus Eisenbacteria bacterium]|uniref:Bifunctional nuclease family protein n=1 Tax=Eiseniibacteriota bacterium TaxID=2212470 RepID=A0A948RVB7_UNCEI|nr:bifunctional nuclease family protein [Candidatus Eisenbacteria bacterium]MBU1950664.1 bifunctional nuclease family protein [Candidatus Eisenbacteria bacterium]MBU2689637.1 bifunctional nuclease family protein [Candidatus Eisenbacteria bacterium]